MNGVKCYEHSTFVENVDNTKVLFEKVDKMLTRMNVILGGLVVSSILLAVNLIITYK
jgi:hypothetical protein